MGMEEGSEEEEASYRVICIFLLLRRRERRRRRRRRRRDHRVCDRGENLVWERERERENDGETKDQRNGNLRRLLSPLTTCVTSQRGPVIFRYYILETRVKAPFLATT